jgi:predicted dehydrogenase
MTSRTDIDAVIITTPTFLHKEMIIDALSKNKAVFVEKPLAKTYGECREIMGHVGHRVTSVGYCRRFLATYRKIKETIDSGILGMPLAFEGSINVNMVRKQTKGWQYSLESGGGGVTIDLGCHLIDIIHYLLGDFKEVSAVKSNFFSRSVEDFLMGTARMKNDAIGSIHASWSYGGSRYPEMGIQIEFENGRIEATDRDLSITMADKGDSKGQHNYWTKQQLAYPVPINLAGPEYTLEDIHFIECIKGSKESMCSFHQSTKTNLVIDSLYRSAELDKPIVIASEAGE